MALEFLFCHQRCYFLGPENSHFCQKCPSLRSILVLPLDLHLLADSVEVVLLPVEGGHHPHHVRVGPQEVRDLFLESCHHSSCGPGEPLTFKPVSKRATNIGCRSKIESIGFLSVAIAAIVLVELTNVGRLRLISVT